MSYEQAFLRKTNQLVSFEACPVRAADGRAKFINNLRAFLVTTQGSKKDTLVGKLPHRDEQRNLEKLIAIKEDVQIINSHLRGFGELNVIETGNNRAFLLEYKPPTHRK